MLRPRFPALLVLLGWRPAAGAKEIPTAKPEDVGMSSKKLDEIRPKLESFVKEKKISGAITIVARGRIVYADAIGSQDIEDAKPMQMDSILRFYSMTKPITSVAAMILVEEGKLGLDDPVSKYLPEFKNLKVFVKESKEGIETEAAKRPMTVRDLLRHTAGLTYGFFGEGAVDKLYVKTDVLDRAGTLEQMVTKLGDLPLIRQPGEEWVYSVSVDVLGRIVEVVSGEPLDAFFKKRIFVPLDMKDTAFSVPKEKVARFATNYTPTEDGKSLKPSDKAKTSQYLTPPKLLSGGGGLVSTARDYLRFCQMLLNGGQLDGTRILKAETVAMMTKNQVPKKAMPIGFGALKRPGLGFGLGFSVRTAKSIFEPAGRVGEYGWGGAASTHFWISPKDELVVVTLTQLMPFSSRLEDTVKPIVYGAIVADETK